MLKFMLKNALIFMWGAFIALLSVAFFCDIEMGDMENCYEIVEGTLDRREKLFNQDSHFKSFFFCS